MQAFISNMDAMFLHKNIPSSFICNPQGLPTIQTSTSRKLLWYTQVYLSNGILPSNRKSCSTPVYNIHGPSECKAQGDRPYTNKRIPGDAIFMTFQEQATLTYSGGKKTKQWGCPWAWACCGIWLVKASVFCVLIRDLGNTVYIFVKTQCML